MINVSSYRKMDSQLDVLGNTTWGIRKVYFVKHTLDRDVKKSKFSDCLAEFSVYFNGKSKNFLLKMFSKIFQNGAAMLGDIYVVKTSIFGPAFQIKQQASIYIL